MAGALARDALRVVSVAVACRVLLPLDRHSHAWHRTIPGRKENLRSWTAGQQIASLEVIAVAGLAWVFRFL